MEQQNTLTVEAANLAQFKAMRQSLKEGDGWFVEADGRLNDASRNMILAIHTEYGQAWLGKVNLYTDEDRSTDPRS